MTNEIRYGRFTVIESLPNEDGHRQVLARCECGTTKVVRFDNLVNGQVKSCGCLRRGRMSILNRSHGESGRNRTSLYRTWEGMWRRCSDPKSYPTYVGRRVHAEWKDFSIFKRWIDENLGESPAGFTLDRIDNNGHYEPGNLRWASAETQGKNRIDNRFITVNGVTKCLADWARALGCRPPTILQRIRHGWKEEDAVTVPVRPHRIKPV